MFSVHEERCEYLTILYHINNNAAYARKTGFLDSILVHELDDDHFNCLFMSNVGIQKLRGKAFEQCGIAQKRYPETNQINLHSMPIQSVVMSGNGLFAINFRFRYATILCHYLFTGWGPNRSS